MASSPQFGDRFAIKSNGHGPFYASLEQHNGGSAADVWARWRIAIRLSDGGEQALGFLLAHAPRGNYDEPNPVQRALDGLTHGLDYPGPNTVYWSIEGREYEEDGTTPQEYSNPQDPITNLWLDASCPGGGK